MHGTSRDITAITFTIGPLLAARDERHFAINNDVNGFGSMSMVGVERVRRIFPRVRSAEPFVPKLFMHRFFVYADVPTK